MLASVSTAITELQAGRMVILVDDEHRENEGDLVVAAECVTPEIINFMISHGRGLVCLPMAPEWIERLQLPMMVGNNRSPYGTAFTVSIEAAEGVTTGISAQDRAKTILTAVNPNATAQDLVSPGHVFPLKAERDGVFARKGQTEGSVDLVKLAGFSPAAVICEILNEEGESSRREALMAFSEKHGIPVLKIQDIIDYRVQHENLVQAIASSRLPLHDRGDFDMTVFDSPLDSGAEHFSLVKPSRHPIPLVRIHCECITGDVLGSARCDCGFQLAQALDAMGSEGGILIYLRQEGRGIGLVNKLKAYTLQEQGLDTVEANLELGFPADSRDYAIAFQILKHMGIEEIRLMTNNPLKVQAIEKYGIKVRELLPLLVTPTQENYQYLKTKQQKLGHFLCIA